MLEQDLHSPELKQNKNNQNKTIKKKSTWIWDWGWNRRQFQTWFNPEKDGSWEVLTVMLLFLFPTGDSKHLLQWRPIPIRKLSGLMSLCIKFFVCTYSILLIIWKKKEGVRDNYVIWIVIQESNTLFLNYFSRSQIYFNNFI